jgi:2-oxoglutarate dehydrogenase E2 component (dihydrolipoamide succinyltransferase)
MDVIMPQLGETVLEGTVARWYKSLGDTIKADEPLFEVETDKVTTEIPSPATGVVSEILVATGVPVKVGTRLAVIKTAVGAVAPALTPGEAGTAAPSSAPNPPATSTVALAKPLPRSLPGGPNLSPIVRRLLAEHGVTPDQILGSGAQGRITREDVLAFLNRAGMPIPATTRSAASAPPMSSVNSAAGAAAPTPVTFGTSSALPDAGGVGAGPDDLIVPLNKIRRLTGIHMVRSKATSPHALQAVEVDFHQVERARQALGEQWKAREGYSLTYLPFVARAVCDAIAKFPYVNASFSDAALIVHRRVHLGIAVDLRFDGLMVTVVRDAHRRNLRGLAEEIHRLAKNARDGTLNPDDVAGGTYTISNSGPYGTLFSASIINQPQAAILSMDSVRKRPVVIEGPEGDAIAIRPVGILAQSFDHRAFDGAYAAAFLHCVKDLIQTRDWLAECSSPPSE